MGLIQFIAEAKCYLPACLFLWPGPVVCVCLPGLHAYIFPPKQKYFLLFTTIVKSNKRIIQSSMRKQKNKKKRKKAHVNCEHFLFFYLNSRFASAADNKMLPEQQTPAKINVHTKPARYFIHIVKNIYAQPTCHTMSHTTHLCKSTCTFIIQSYSPLLLSPLMCLNKTWKACIIASKKKKVATKCTIIIENCRIILSCLFYSFAIFSGQDRTKK